MCNPPHSFKKTKIKGFSQGKKNENLEKKFFKKKIKPWKQSTWFIMLSTIGNSLLYATSRGNKVTFSTPQDSSSMTNILLYRKLNGHPYIMRYIISFASKHPGDSTTCSFTGQSCSKLHNVAESTRVPSFIQHCYLQKKAVFVLV